MAEAKAYKMIPHCTKDTITYEMDELVRCKDCALSHPWNDEEVQCRNRRISQVYVKPDWYCADGERKD